MKKTIRAIKNRLLDIALELLIGNRCVLSGYYVIGTYHFEGESSLIIKPLKKVHIVRRCIFEGDINSVRYR